MSKGQSTCASCNAFCHAKVTSVQLLYGTRRKSRRHTVEIKQTRQTYQVNIKHTINTILFSAIHATVIKATIRIRKTLYHTHQFHAKKRGGGGGETIIFLQQLTLHMYTIGHTPAIYHSAACSNSIHHYLPLCCMQ